MTGYPIRKRPTGTAREVAELHAVFAQDPGYYGTPLARALAQLSSEYSAIGNYAVARRHMNASLRAMQSALDDPAIDDHRRRAAVEFFWDSACLYHAMGQLEKALADFDEALKWDRATWDAHEYCLDSRELRHSCILSGKAAVMAKLGRVDESNAARAEAILMALSDPDFEEYDASSVTSSMANDLVSALD